MSSSFMRPDEQSTNSEIERSRKRDSNLGKGIKAAGTIASVATVAGLGAKLMPLLSRMIPTDLALRGIDKVAPQIGNLLKKGQSMGLNVEEGLNFIKDQIQSKPQEKAKDSRNIIEKYSPELFSFLKEQIGKGKSPVEAGALAQLPKSQFSPIIKKMEEDNKSNWTSIIESVFGSAQQPAQSQPPQKSSAEMMESKMKNFFSTQQQQPQQAPQQQQQQPQQQMGAGQQALMQMLQQINQKLG